MVAHRQAPCPPPRRCAHRDRFPLSLAPGGSMTAARRATPIPTFCAVCRRHAVALGYVPPKQYRAPLIWLCDDEYCHAAAARTYAMPGPMLDAYELAAMLEAGGIAAEYLEGLGITDIAKL